MVQKMARANKHLENLNACISADINILQTVDQYKYLGVLFKSSGNFNSHVDALSRGAGRALGSVINKIHGLKDFGFNSYDKLFLSCVASVLDYCSDIWGFKQY